MAVHPATVAVVCLVAALLCGAAVAAEVSYNLKITYGFWAPDCVNRQIYLINGQYPGPTLTGMEGDTMVVRVENHLHLEGLAIHWHGIRQLNTNLEDGVSGVTQCPITPGDYKEYRFTLDKAGTFMYHGHLSEQSSAGMYGSLIVQETPSAPFPYPYDGELSLIANDWYHRSIYEQLAGLDSKPFIWIGNPQSLLLNGKGQYNCALIPSGFNQITGDVKFCNATNPQCAREVFTVEQGKTYRFRVVSIASLHALNLVVEGHTMTMVASDSYTVKPFNVTDGLDIFAGQTYDFILKADKPVGNYWVRLGVIGRNDPQMGLGVLRYVGAPAVDPTTAPPVTRLWNNLTYAVAQADSYRGDSSTPRMPPRRNPPPRMLVLTGVQQLIDGYIKWAINNISLAAPPIPYSLGLAKPTAPAGTYGPPPPDALANPWNLSVAAPTEAFYGTGFYQFKFNEYIDIVLQNSVGLSGGVSEYHPWHLHGHQFWVLGYGSFPFNPATDRAKFNLVDPPFRNTVAVMAFGWVAIRMRADNPGAWLFHCHINAHLHMGMAVVFVDGYVMNPPAGTPQCGRHLFGYP